MASEKQRAANQENSKLSTGPKTETGKSKSRINAWKHGLTAENIVIDGEDAQQFDAIRQELWDQYQPAHGMESLLVERLALWAWRIRRAFMFEAALLKEGASRALALAYADGNALATLLRYEISLTNASHRTLQQLLYLQDRRRDESEGLVIEGEPGPVQMVPQLAKPPAAAE